MKIYHCYKTMRVNKKEIINTFYVGTRFKDALFCSYDQGGAIIDIMFRKEIIKSFLVFNGYIVKEINKSINNS